ENVCAFSPAWEGGVEPDHRLIAVEHDCRLAELGVRGAARAERAGHAVERAPKIAGDGILPGFGRNSEREMRLHGYADVLADAEFDRHVEGDLALRIGRPHEEWENEAVLVADGVTTAIAISRWRRIAHFGRCKIRCRR